jgi:hypothetical protein
VRQIRSRSGTRCFLAKRLLCNIATHQNSTRICKAKMNSSVQKAIPGKAQVRIFQSKASAGAAAAEDAAQCLLYALAEGDLARMIVATGNSQLATVRRTDDRIGFQRGERWNGESVRSTGQKRVSLEFWDSAGRHNRPIPWPVEPPSTENLIGPCIQRRWGVS